MTDLLNSFVGITSGDAVTVGNSGGSSGTAFTSVNGSVTCQTSADLTQAYDRGAVVAVSGSAVSDVRWTLADPTTTCYFRRYFRAASAPPATVRLMRFTSADGLTLLGEFRLTAAGQFLITGAAGQVIQQTASGVFQTGVKYRLEVHVVAGAMTMQVSTPAEAVSSPIAVTTVGAYEGTAIGAVRFGTYFAANQTWSHDMAAVGASPTAALSAAAPAALAHVRVWDGTYELAVQGVGVWDGASEDAAVSVAAIAPAAATSDAGALPIGTSSYAVPGSGVIYVATTGSDGTGDGSVGNPYATLAHADSVAATGNTIVMRGGTYGEGGDPSRTSQTDTARYGVILQTQDLTVQAAANEAVWFDGSTTAVGWVSDGGRWRLDHVAVWNRSPTTAWNGLDGTTVGWQWVDPAWPTAPDPQQVWYDGVPLQQVATLAEVTSGKFYVSGTTSGTNGFTFTSSAYYIGDNPSGHSLRIGQRASALMLLATGITVRGIGFRRYGPSVPDFGAIRMNRADGALENVVIEDCAGAGVNMDGCTNGALTKVTITGAKLMGGNGYKSDSVVLDRCVFTGNTRGRFNRAPVSGAWKHTKSLDFTMKNSIASDNLKQGVWCDESVTGILILSCDVQRNGGNGIVVEISEGADILDNLVTDNARNGIYVSGVNNSRAWCNTVRRNGSDGASFGGIHVYQDARRPATFPSGMDGTHDLAWHQANCSWAITSIQCKNNISDEPPANGHAFRMHDPEKTQGGYNGMGFDADGNLFCQKNGDVAQMFLIPTRDTSVATAWASLPPYRTYVAPEEAQSAEQRGGGVCVLDDDHRLTSLGATLANPVPLPADIAALLGRSTGELVIGATR